MKSVKVAIITLAFISSSVYANGQSLVISPITPKPIMLGTHITWKDSRDSKITKQDVDYSCGASSLSTILTYFYQHPKTEQQILDDMALDDVMASFAEIGRAHV